MFVIVKKCDQDNQEERTESEENQSTTNYEKSTEKYETSTEKYEKSTEKYEKSTEKYETSTNESKNIELNPSCEITATKTTNGTLESVETHDESGKIEPVKIGEDEQQEGKPTKFDNKDVKAAAFHDNYNDVNDNGSSNIEVLEQTFNIKGEYREAVESTNDDDSQNNNDDDNEIHDNDNDNNPKEKAVGHLGDKDKDNDSNEELSSDDDNDEKEKYLLYVNENRDKIKEWNAMSKEEQEEGKGEHGILGSEEREFLARSTMVSLLNNFSS